jgi:hypothetical protein
MLLFCFTLLHCFAPLPHHDKTSTRIILNRDAAILCEFANNQDVLAILVQKYTIVGVKMVEQFNAYENGSRQLLFCVSLFPISGCLDQ